MRAVGDLPAFQAREKTAIPNILTGIAIHRIPFDLKVLRSRPIYLEKTQNSCADKEGTMMSLVALKRIVPEGIDHFLLDGAKLYIHPEDSSAMKTWTPATPIMITVENVLSDYPFRFINTETGESIRVKFEE
jgi:hypothetical protein